MEKIPMALGVIWVIRSEHNLALTREINQIPLVGCQSEMKWKLRGKETALKVLLLSYK
jgi:hypothetical protein